MEKYPIDYQRVADAIEYMNNHFRQQPNLEEVAGKVYLSPQHFQRIFTEWAGVSPKKFMQYLSLEHLRNRIQFASNLHEAAEMVGFSAQSRVYDLFVKVEGVTPQEYKTAGQGLDIRYGFHHTPFGEVLIATTEKGICNLAFVEEATRQAEFGRLVSKWNSAKLIADNAGTEGIIQQVFDRQPSGKFHLWVQGTSFQLKVWEALLRIPAGAVSTYQKIAEGIGNPGAVRAVGTAIGQNPVAYLIPCHRVIRAAGQVGEYHWGHTRKQAILGREMATAAMN